MTSWLFVTLSVICAWKEPNIYYEPPSRPELTTMHMEQLRDFLASFSAISPPKIERGRWGRLGWLPTIAVSFNDLEHDRRVFVELDARDGTVIFFMRNPLPGTPAFYDPEKDKGEPMEAYLSAEEAFELALPVLRHLNLSTQMDDYTIEPHFARRPTLAEGSWSVERELTYNGIECYKCWIDIQVRAATREVELVSYQPPIPPRAISSRISKDEARARVSQWIKTDREFSRFAQASVDESEDVREILVIPPEFKKMRTLPEEPWQSSYCWEVPVKVGVSEAHIRKGQFGIVPIPVEMDTGRILIDLY